MKELIVSDDAAKWAFQTFGYAPVRYDVAFGVVENNQIVGAAMFHGWSGDDVEVSYYGPLTLGIVKKLARIAVNQLGVSRITARTARNNKTVTRGIKGIGFEYEGVRKCAYGEHDAIMYGLYGKNLARFVGVH